MTLFLYKSLLSIWITCCQFFFTNCRITIHYFLPYIYIYIYIYIYTFHIYVCVRSCVCAYLRKCKQNPV